MFKNRIVTKLGLTIILLLFTILLPLGFVMNQVFSDFYTAQVRQDIGELALRYAATIASREDAKSIGMIEMMSEFTDTKVVITDAQGVVIGSSGIQTAGNRIPIAGEQIERLAEGRSVSLEMSEQQTGERFLGIGQPIIDETKLDGAVFVFSSVGALDQSLQKVRQLLWLSGAGAVFLALGVTYIVSKKLSSPLIQMERATRRMAKGELEIRVAVPANDEIGSLAQAVNDLAKELQRYRDTRGQFLANISHELRTPMTYLEGYAKMLRDEVVDSEEERKKYLDIIYQETIRLSRLVHDVFELSKMEEGKVSLELEWVDLSDILFNVAHRVRPKAEQKGLVLDLEIAKQTPFIYADGLRMEQIFMNLLDNAIRYTEEGRISLCVLVPGGGNVVNVTVEDTGAGIPSDELLYIFERFYRVEKSRSRAFGGTGLGLAIVKQLVELQGGSIRVVSEINKGTRFELIFPVGGNQS